MKFCYLCGSGKLEKICEITEKPSPEVDYGIPSEKYYREIYRCPECGVFSNHHDLIDDETFYKGDYNKAIDPNKLTNRFNKIINLPEENSDNKQRVKRIISFLKSRYDALEELKSLDVGSGTCVFSYELKKQASIKTYCIDPDPASVEHARTYAEVDGAFEGTLADYPEDAQFDLITFNKVLEHVKNPIEIIEQAIARLKPSGHIYIELPESDRIVTQNLVAQRAEFAVEHYTVFNKQSMKYIASVLNLEIENLEVITDPSGKMTIYAFYSSNA